MFYLITSNKTKRVYLSIEEINKLKNLELNSNLKKSRDAFVLMCYIGLRYSDYEKINRNNITDDFLDITMTKTNEQVSIPIHPSALQIILKYEYVLPKFSNQQLNKQLLKVTDLFGRETKETNQILIYIYDDGSEEKKVIIE